jgi:HD superfamily phosphohydrolase YqeK
MLKERRYQHVVSVASHAKRLAVRNFCFKTKIAYEAGLAHDIFKLLPVEEQKAIALKYKPN